jgi:SAM-dependent methyltransferase
MAEHPMVKVGRLLQGAWAASALAQLMERGLDEPLARDDPSAPLLLAVGLLEEAGDGYRFTGREELRGYEGVVLANLRSSLGQAYAIANGKKGWPRSDEAVLTAQGVASSAGGRAFADMIRSIPHLNRAFEAGGVLLDVGVGVAALACAFCEEVPNSTVIGLDVLPRALELARQLVAQKNLEDRIDLRLIGIEDFDEEQVADLAHMSPIFIPPDVVPRALKRISAALKPGGWLVLSGIVAGGPQGGPSRWMAHNAGGSALDDTEAAGLAADAGFGPPVSPPLPVGAPRVLLFEKL